MCGITGILAFNEVGRFNLTNLEKATRSLAHRGPDYHNTYFDHFVGLGHRRLSIIDTSANAHQPLEILDGRYVISFNGEIFNYKSLKQELLSNGIHFKSDSDTEVLLHLFAREGSNCLQKLNGFFAFAIYDAVDKTLFIARDRLGIKPLLYYEDEFKFLFASELESILAYGIEKELDYEALGAYLQLNYIPAPLTMVKGVKKLEPGHFIEIREGQSRTRKYYDLPDNLSSKYNSYGDAQDQLCQLLHNSVERRMIADVPLGCFLSGGIDSSVITAIASSQTQSLKTFSIGFKDNKFFDETNYAESVAAKFKTDHTTFMLSNDELTSHLENIVNHFDEPFADSSSIPVYLLSKKTKQHVTVALSGDGADEIFSGYNKHAGWWKIENDQIFKNLIGLARPVASLLPSSRSSITGNLARQIIRFAKAMKLSPKERYWFLASFTSQTEVHKLLKPSFELDSYYQHWLEEMDGYSSINDLLRLDTKFVLPNDMLKKVDLMSMANGLEVRVPFLDHEVVEFVMGLSADMKIHGSMRKRILQDTFRSALPKELYNRPKKGFEMPLQKWLKTSLRAELNEHLFDRDRIESQGLFHWNEIDANRKQLFSNNPGDSHAKVWALYVFQKWYTKFF